MIQATKFVITALVILTLAASVEAKTDLLKDFDSLGGNDALLEKAKALNPEASISLVQRRVVPRQNRLEIAPEFSSVLGGDSYNRTQNFGANFHYHFTPRWSVGLKYNYSFNKLRPEGENLVKDTAGVGKAVVPDIDYPKQQGLVLLNWYPVYGKMNLYDLGITHFDVYALVGGGIIELASGGTATYTAGGGVGFWWSQHLTSRAELRYQTYRASRYTGSVDMNTTVASVQVGYLL